MKFIKVKKQHYDTFEEFHGAIESARTGMIALTSQLRNAEKRFWKMAHDLYPESVGINSRYDSNKKEFDVVDK